MRLGALLATGVAAGLLVNGASGHAVDARSTALATPVADTYVSVDAPRQNFGSADSLKVSARPFSAAYLRFRVSVPAGATVLRATLQLYSAAKSATGFTVHPVTSTTWGERTIDYASVPRIQPAALAASGPY